MKKMIDKRNVGARLFACVLVAFLLLLSGAARAQTTAFTFQGTIPVKSTSATEMYEMQFKLFDAASGGSQVGQTLTGPLVPVKNGGYTVELDFGAAAFPGADRWVEVSFRRYSSDPFKTLPRVQLLPVPYAIHSLASDTAASASSLVTQNGSVSADDLVRNDDPRLTDARDPNPGSSNYVQNTSSQQAGVNFNIGGTGTANVFNALTQYNLAGDRLIGVLGNNLFAGFGTGIASTPSSVANSFFGTDAGRSNTNGTGNSFFGTQTGTSNTNGIENSFFGVVAGGLNTTGSENAFFGNQAGFHNTTGSRNAFFGFRAGENNQTGTFNSALGDSSGVDAIGLHFATAIGSFARVSTNDTIVLGKAAGNYDGAARPADTVKVPGDLNVLGSSSASAFTAGTQYNIEAERVLSVAGANLFVGSRSGKNNTTGQRNTFVGLLAGQDNETGENNTFVGTSANGRATTSSNTLVGAFASSSNNSHSTALGAGARSVGEYSTAIGADAVAVEDKTVVLGRKDGQEKVVVPGLLKVEMLGSAGSTQLCRNASNEIGNCSSSLRYKTDIKPFGSGLRLVDRLHPISFKWKEGGASDLGLGAEDVAKIEPLLVTYNSSGQVEGVKYDRIGVVLLNAVKEQQLQIERQAKMLAEQETLIRQMRRTLCGRHRSAAFCR